MDQELVTRQPVKCCCLSLTELGEHAPATGSLLAFFVAAPAFCGKGVQAGNGSLASACSESRIGFACLLQAFSRRVRRIAPVQQAASCKKCHSMRDRNSSYLLTSTALQPPAFQKATSNPGNSNSGSHQEGGGDAWLLPSSPELLTPVAQAQLTSRAARL